MKSDQEYLESIKRSYVKRRVVASVYMLLGIALLFINYSIYSLVTESKNEFITTKVVKLENKSVTEELIGKLKNTINITYSLGVNIGFVVGLLLMVSAICLALSLNVILFNRRERLLIKYYEEEKT